MLYKKILLAAFVFGGLVAGALAQDPDAKANNAWISISGWAISADENSFVLDYGKNTVVVELNDWQWYSDNYDRVEDFRITVYGKVDDDLYETMTIDAQSVYVEGAETYFYAGDADQTEADFYDWAAPRDIEVGQVTITGTVTGLDGRKFSIARGKRKVTVDTMGMESNPMDDLGFQKIEQGDVVKVIGELEAGSFEKREIAADKVITLENADSKN